MQKSTIHSFVTSSTNQITPGMYKTSISGMYVIMRTIHKDERGFFSEIARINEVDTIRKEPFVVKQINHARSEKNVARGIHAEGWNKLITITQGTAFIAVSDIRKESDTYLHVVTMKLGFAPDALQASLFLPSGVGNSLCVLDGPVDYIYSVDRLYAERDKKGDAAISLFDPTLAIPWPIPKKQMILSVRDYDAQLLR